MRKHANELTIRLNRICQFTSSDMFVPGADLKYCRGALELTDRSEKLSH
jgi:hypothetical protein